ncbi:helicase C-terminal domain-containing protein [Verminephrobacter aporrectodeae]|nr:helicase C-terminal domain-containing protein [Verminephrobacter aporrectodeae]
MALHIRLPLIESPSKSAAENIAEHYRHLLFLSLEARIQPRPFDVSGLKTAPLRLSDGMLARLQKAATGADVDIKQAFASLCSEGLALHEAQRTAAATRLTPMAAPVDMGRFKSIQQAAFYRGMLDGLAGKKIVFCEGSTGLGKGRVIAMVACEQAKAGKTPVVISAPSLALVGQLYAEVVALGDDTVPVAAVVGASEFVDDEALLLYLQRAQDDPKLPVDEGVKDWAEDGGKPLNPKAIAAIAAGVSAAWLMDDLRSLCDVMPAEDFSLSEDAGTGARSAARAVVHAMRERAKNVQGIVLCSHMMLAAAQRTRWKGTLPMPKCILLDEAHLFESAVARVNSVQLSLFSMRVSLKRYIAAHEIGPSSVASQMLRDVGRLGEILQPLGDSANGATVTINDKGALSGPVRDSITQAVESICSKTTSRALEGLQHLPLYQAALEGVLRGMREEVHDKVRLNLSAVRGYPSIDSGPASVRVQLGDIWSTAEGGVALVSATLYAIGEDGEYHCDYTRSALGVPLSRAATPPPVREPHIVNIPTVHTLSASSYADFVPPERSDDGGLAAWHSRVSGAIGRIAQDARGGTLVLCTAYEDTRAIAKNLQDFGDRIVAQKPAHRFSAYVTEFNAKYAAGLRPVLLGVGVAWTGVDLVDGGVPAAEDWMLTDLVVCRLPINFNQSSTMRARVANTGIHPIISEALLYFKQGIGRLIRRDGVIDRNIWILDGRIHPSHSWPGMVRLRAGVRRMLRDYPKRQEADFILQALELR